MPAQTFLAVPLLVADLLPASIILARQTRQSPQIYPYGLGQPLNRCRDMAGTSLVPLAGSIEASVRIGHGRGFPRQVLADKLAVAVHGAGQKHGKNGFALPLGHR